MRNLLQKCFKWQWLVCLAVGCCFSSCKDDEESTSGYDPNKLVELADFYPTTGRLSTQVILNGSNFGNNTENVKVFFNDKEAAIISVKDNKMLVLAPRRASIVENPKCIIKVQVGDQIKQYDKLFDYYIQTNVTTLVGGSTSSKTNPVKTVPLSEAQFMANLERSICVDANKNIYFLVDNDGKYAAYMLNEEADQLKCLAEDLSATMNSPVLGYDPQSGSVYQFYSQKGSMEYKYFNPQKDYELTDVGKIKMDKDVSDYNTPAWFGVWFMKWVFTMGPDNMLYSRFTGGAVVRYNLKTGQGENLTLENQAVGTKDGNTYGLVFDPKDSNIFYFSNNDKHCIYKYNLLTREYSVWAGQEGQSGYLDGPITEARFNKPGQMCVDSEGNIIFCDTENHCIRKITMSTGYVSTIAGIPQKSGWIDGTSENAMFKKPIGLCIDADDVMYVGDSENRAIRRVAVE